MGLVACPFCREMFEKGERAECPVCGVALAAFEKLPARPEHLVGDDDIPEDPAFENLPLTHMGRGRAAMIGLAALGLGLFFFNWAVLDQAGDVYHFTGLELAQHKYRPLWLAGVAWFVMIPAVLSRRSIMKMRGARVAVAVLAVLPAMLAATLLINRPERNIVTRVDYGWPVWATLVVSILAALVAIRFGGKVDDVKTTTGSSAGNTLH